MRRTSAFSILIAIAVPAAAQVRESASRYITGDGIGKLQVGMPASQVKAQLKVSSDRLESDSEGGQIRTIRVALESGQVAAEIVEEKVWRITVQKPGPRTSSGIGIGTSLKVLLKESDLRGDLGEGALYVQTAALCGMSFRLTHELKTDKEFMTPWTWNDLSTLPPTTSIHSILLVGCKK